MSHSRATLVDWAQYAAARLVLGGMHCFGVEQNLFTAAAIGSAIYHGNRRRRQRAHDHVATSFPEWPASRVAQVVEGSYRHMMQMFLIDAVATSRFITHDGWPRHVIMGELQSVIDLLVRGEPCILLTGHCGNWELLASLLAVLGYPVHALARPIDNPLVDRWLLDMREARGTRILTKWGAMPMIQEVLRDGGRAAFIADQNAGDGGLFIPFFGRLASSYKSIALLAMRYRVPVIAGHAQRVAGEFRYRLVVNDIIRPEDWLAHPDPVFYITARYNRAIEIMARQVPEQYLWIHRRWKSRPRHVREGRPMPPKLRDRLSSLPWMTEAELNRLFENDRLEVEAAMSTRPATAPPVIDVDGDEADAPGNAAAERV